jgi:hypothetical protein
LICRFAGLTSLFSRALRLASRLLELLLCRSKLVLQLLQLALQIANLALDRLDAIDRSALRRGYPRYRRGA